MEAWSKLAEFAGTYAQLFLKCPDPAVEANQAALNVWKKTWVAQITNQTDPTHFFFMNTTQPLGHISIRYAYMVTCPAG